ncbi:5-deoxy-glucuronate isomerase [Myxococcota bacterium]|jgi:5-deoxy-glucuronate isomerase|nr:5-deoxy-glucuronate isomerase [Myxococcota bacterium]
MNEHPCHLRHPDPFPEGVTPITRIGGTPDTGMAFDMVVLGPGEVREESCGEESAWLLLEGKASLVWPEGSAETRRDSLFEEVPTVLHLPPNVPLRVQAASRTEFARIRVPNDRTFAPRLFDGNTAPPEEHRDQGRWDDMAHRIVRTVFDSSNRPESNLVLGEVITLPGRWSSYPPHHHPHPEIYHYRFTRHQGYGHGELGEEVRKVRHQDTLLILDGVDHSQVAAPGYGMYYLWVIRHLPGHPYLVPEFTEDHLWLRDPDAGMPRCGRRTP